MLPPLPPSPPLGPPRGTNFSRRKAMQPWPPSPALTVILASSMNMPLEAILWRPAVLFDRLNRDESSRRAFVFKLHDSGNLCEECIVLANTNIQAWLEFRAALTNQYRSAGHELAGKALDSEPLGVAVTAVARTSNSFFVSHKYL